MRRIEERTTPPLTQAEIAQLVAQRREVYADEPHFDGQVAFYLQAWNQCGSHRALGFGVVGPIPYREIQNWCDDEDVDDDTRELVHAVLSHLEAERIAKLPKPTTPPAEPKRKKR